MSKNVFAYATSYYFDATEPTSVTAVIEDVNVAGWQPLNTHANGFKIEAWALGDTIMVFTATDGVSQIEYRVNLHVVAKTAEIAFYEELKRQGKDYLFEQMVRIEIAHGVETSDSWKRKAQQWRWGEIGDQVRKYIQKVC